MVYPLLIETHEGLEKVEHHCHAQELIFQLDQIFQTVSTYVQTNLKK
jgi:hypothetical protein